MNVLVTGAAGCLGSELCLLLRQRGHSVTGIDDLSRYALLGEEGVRPRDANLAALNIAGVKFYALSVTDWCRAPSALVFDAVVHAAAQTCHSRKVDVVWDNLDVNLLQTVRLLDWAGDRPFLFISSAKIYRENFDLPSTRLTEVSRGTYWYSCGVDESCPLGDQTVLTHFGVSKIAADLTCQEYALAGRTVGVFRPGCFTGARALATEAQNWLPWLVHCARTGTSFRIFGYEGKQIRDLLHASDLADACLKWLERPRSGVWNIGGGPERSISLNDAIALVGGLTKLGVQTVTAPKRPGDIFRLVIDSGRFRRDYGWEPRVSLREIFEEACSQ